MDFPITFQCNNDCISCIFDTKQMRLMRSSPVYALVDYITKQVNAECVSITGGEPTLLEELPWLLGEIRKKMPKKHIFVVSNGRKFADKEFAKKFSELRLGNFKIGIPIFSHDARVHDRITKAKGSWKETIIGINNLVKLGIDVEVRIIVNKMNYREMEETAEFIARELKGILRVIFINMKYTGNAFINRKELFVRYSSVAPFVQKAADILTENGFEVKMFHFPLCLIGEKYWPMASGTTKQEKELAFSKNCRGCTVRDRCARIWISYLPLAGEKEFKPV